MVQRRKVTFLNLIKLLDFVRRVLPFKHFLFCYLSDFFKTALANFLNILEHIIETVLWENDL